MRGEDVSGGIILVQQDGSPPHARGRPPPRVRTICAPWITPACAGKTILAWRWSIVGSDHPRMRGEDPKGSSSMSRLAGSPPHARGRLRAGRGRRAGVGITPACAGKTDGVFGECGRDLDHPRMRGEDVDKFIFPVANKGSPPHARGRHLQVCRAILPTPITPACAGKTLLLLLILSIL